MLHPTRLFCRIFAPLGLLCVLSVALSGGTAEAQTTEEAPSASGDTAAPPAASGTGSVSARASPAEDEEGAATTTTTATTGASATSTAASPSAAPGGQNPGAQTTSAPAPAPTPTPAPAPPAASPEAAAAAAPAEAEEEPSENSIHFTGIRIGVSLGGGFFVGDISGGMGGLGAQLGVQLGPLGIAYMFHIFYGQYAAGGLSEDFYAAWNTLMFDYRFLRFFEVGFGPSLDLVWNCAAQACRDGGPYFGLEARFAVKIPIFKIGVGIHPTFFPGGAANTVFLYLGF